MNARYKVLDPIRGIAALLVCICHFKIALPYPFNEIAQHGELGVYAFFVASGFIIPYSMYNSGYKITNIATFWAKRIIRLHPTFLVALAATLTLSYFATKLKGQPTAFSATDALNFSFYLSIPAENPVIWTLIIELKYYIFISIFFPLLFSEKRYIRTASFIITAISATALCDLHHDFTYAPYFLLGFTACHVATKRISHNELITYLIVTIGAISTSSAIQSISGLIAFTIIVANPSYNSKPLHFLGQISYSLYLIHFPLGVKIINLTLPRIGTTYGPVLFFTTIAISIIAAYGAFLAIERPTSNWASKIKYKH